MPLTHHYATTLCDLSTHVTPQILRGQKLEMVNEVLAHELNLPVSWWQDNQITALLGQSVSALSHYAVAQKYGGHQFGQWNPTLGDGRGLLLAEANCNGASVDLHLKGAGQTPYSRGADGRAVLRSTLREYLGSEALHALGIPSSRGLCLFSSEETVLREQLEPAAMMIRTAPSHIRFGHFEYFFQAGETDKLNALFDYTLQHHFSECAQASNPHQALLRAITLRTARLIALWQSYGFVHGVMNTDNMSIHGITFDFGPFAMLERYDPKAVFNHSDYQGRYAFDQQPGIGLWNLNCLAHSFSGHCSTEQLREVLTQYEPAFIAQYQHHLCSRLGLNAQQPSHINLANQWLAMLKQSELDYNNSFRTLAGTSYQQAQPQLRNDFINRQAFDQWWQDYQVARAETGVSESELKAVNPAVIPRTHLLQEAITQANSGDFTFAEALLKAFHTPFDTQWDEHRFSTASQSHTPGTLSCSS
ncbi:protein adenylyltransferase SelO family protein [Alteromonas sp. C1M14]|uniref:protein adenylyltransferase SelO n=1 Tax=Alteromonas sp. C1M14 TaxID=2841567 RepID=UPI001C0A3FB5|nr:YdiU family protein [Alteromonas sp. C1M14]MBU2980065.1 YdiU family protein [Alteromonas sp. C1M14]